MRIIDADGLIQYIEKVYDGYNLYDVVEHWKDLVNKQPTVDPWKYPSKGELPDKDVECLVRTKLGNNFIAMIDSSDNCWCTGEFFGEYLEDDCVACWQYIEPPKEEA